MSSMKKLNFKNLSINLLLPTSQLFVRSEQIRGLVINENENQASTSEQNNYVICQNQNCFCSNTPELSVNIKLKNNLICNVNNVEKDCSIWQTTTTSSDEKSNKINQCHLCHKNTIDTSSIISFFQGSQKTALQKLINSSKSSDTQTCYDKNCDSIGASLCLQKEGVHTSTKSSIFNFFKSSSNNWSEWTDWSTCPENKQSCYDPISQSEEKTETPEENPQIFKEYSMKTRCCLSETCQGEAVQIQLCNNLKMENTCPYWSGWSSWTYETFDSCQARRRRSCQVPFISVDSYLHTSTSKSQEFNKYCQGSSSEFMSCWTGWSSCNLETCEQGRSRKRFNDESYQWKSHINQARDCVDDEDMGALRIYNPYTVNSFWGRFWQMGQQQSYMGGRASNKKSCGAWLNWSDWSECDDRKSKSYRLGGENKKKLTSNICLVCKIHKISHISTP